MRKYALLVLPALSLAFAPAPLPRPDARQDDLKRMQGSWAVTADYTDGKLSGPSGLRVVIAEDRLAFFLRESPADRWTITLDAKAKPKALDMKGTGPDSILAVYALVGDTLTISFNPSSWTDRPRDLSPTGAPALFKGAASRRFIVFRREKR